MYRQTPRMDPVNVDLRPYRPADFEALLVMDQVCFAPLFRFSRTFMRQVLEGRGSIVQVAVTANDTEPVGFCAVRLQAVKGHPAAYVNTLEVLPPWRGLTVGQRLLLAVESQAAAAGAKQMTLHVFVANGAAVRLYDRLGYTRVEIARDFYGLGLDAWYYRKELVRWG